MVSASIHNARALEKFRPASKRMEILDINGITFYNDTYNANPDSMIAALQTLAASRLPGRKIAVVADMKELGESSAAEHARVGRAISAMKIECLLTLGGHARLIHDAARVQHKLHYENKSALAEYLAGFAVRGDAVLIKGSRGMKMEDIVVSLQERWATPE